MRKIFSVLLFIVVLAGLIGGGVYCLQRDLTIFAVIFFVLAAVLLIYVIASYNKIVKYKNKVKQGLSLVDVQLKLRFDLVPNLTRLVKKYCEHEKEIIKEVTQTRKQAIEAASEKEKIVQANHLMKSMKNMIAVAEGYPELMADKLFSKFMEELSSIEDRISAARRIYDSNVNEYNTLIQAFPNSMIAKIFMFKEEELFQIDTGEKINVDVGKELL